MSEKINTNPLRKRENTKKNNNNKEKKLLLASAGVSLTTNKPGVGTKLKLNSDKLRVLNSCQIRITDKEDAVNHTCTHTNPHIMHSTFAHTLLVSFCIFKEKDVHTLVRHFKHQLIQSTAKQRGWCCEWRTCPKYFHGFLWF